MWRPHTFALAEQKHSIRCTFDAIVSRTLEVHLCHRGHYSSFTEDSQKSLVLSEISSKGPSSEAAEMAAVEEEIANQGLTSTLKDLFSGAVGGVAQVLIGMQLITFLRLYNCQSFLTYYSRWIAILECQSFQSSVSKTSRSRLLYLFYV